MRNVKVILTAPVHLQRDALRAFDHAYHNSKFSHGFALITNPADTAGGRQFIVRQNKGGYSVRLLP